MGNHISKSENVSNISSQLHHPLLSDDQGSTLERTFNQICCNENITLSDSSYIRFNESGKSVIKSGFHQSFLILHANHFY